MEGPAGLILHLHAAGVGGVEDAAALVHLAHVALGKGQWPQISLFPIDPRPVRLQLSGLERDEEERTKACVQCPGRFSPFLEAPRKGHSEKIGLRC